MTKEKHMDDSLKSFLIIRMFVYFLREVILRAEGGATGRGAAAVAAALDPAGFHTRGGAAFNLGFFLILFLLHGLPGLDVEWQIIFNVIFPINQLH